MSATAAQTLAALDRAGISLEEVTAELVADGVRLFADSFDKLNGALAGKRRRMLGKALNEQTIDASRAASERSRQGGRGLA